ncbi:hypothetical protein NEOC65_000140 [Neochlamydia sp. AcF65]|nr:hypothetical protein [Neochlamydia sp. AcF65]NGY95303.1 hypothetical protein [Neochlamydia sp. AcF84]
MQVFDQIVLTSPCQYFLAICLHKILFCIISLSYLTGYIFQEFFKQLMRISTFLRKFLIKFFLPHLSSTFWRSACIKSIFAYPHSLFSIVSLK